MTLQYAAVTVAGAAGATTGILVPLLGAVITAVGAVAAALIVSGVAGKQRQLREENHRLKERIKRLEAPDG